MNLEPIAPEEALELYLADRSNSAAQATIYSHRSRLGHFIRWADEQEITNLNELTGRQLYAYRIWRRSEGDLTKVTEKTQMDTLRVFVRWLESIDAVAPDLHTKVRSPTLTGDDNVRDVMLNPDRAEAILDYLRKYEYASRPHVVLTLAWHTMMRVGAMHSLDCTDFNPDEGSLEVHHRPDSETPIKNKEQGERYVALSDVVSEILDDWLSEVRLEKTDGHSRRPLISTSHGRAHVSTIRNDCYRYTRPCVIGEGCPHGRSPDDCEAITYENASKCPSSRSPHAFRRGAITHALTEEWPMKAVGDRANVSEVVLERHYDQRSEKAKMEQRREYLDRL